MIYLINKKNGQVFAFSNATDANRFLWGRDLDLFLVKVVKETLPTVYDLTQSGNDRVIQKVFESLLK